MDPARRPSPLHVASVTAFAAERLLPPTSGDEVALTPEGNLVLGIATSMLVRMRRLVLQSSGLDVRPLNRRMQGRSVPQRLEGWANVQGVGQMLFDRGDAAFRPLALERDLCFFAERCLWALTSTLSWDTGSVPGLHGQLDLVRVAGQGQVVLRTAGELVAFRIARSEVFEVQAASLVGWIGALVPCLEPHRRVVRCEGEGTLLLELSAGEPRAR